MSDITGDRDSTEPSPPEKGTSQQGDNAVMTVAGIGASAGGLEALRTLVGALPTRTNMAYIIAQHLSPKHESMLVQLLSRETALPVEQISDGMAIRPNTIAIALANANLVVDDGLLRLTEPEDRPIPKPSVDAFFRSLADEFGDHAVAVVLSGTGSDGSHGIRSIKAAGGFTLAQAPETAKYDGMPRAAMETGCVDLVMPPDRITGELQRIAEMSGRTLLIQPEEKEAPVYDRITRLVHQQTGLDLAAYKEKTIQRRLRRRMAARHLTTLDDYLALLETEPAEVQQFCQDVLISVTSFFRDPDAFTALQEQIGAMLRKRRPGDDIRIWVPGCATGEEAYSLAILLSEMLGPSVGDYRIQIFATDLDDTALGVARRGIYNVTSLAELRAETVNRYFEPAGDRYKVNKALREMLVFARQNLLHDPPFLRLDMISCRNLLIYFNNDAQRRLFELFHYAINPGGLLFLGKSENVTRHEHLFTALDSRWKIFQHRGNRTPRAAPPYPAGAIAPLDDPPTTAAPRPRLSAYDRMVRATLEHYAPPGLLVDDELVIQHILGDTSGYLRIPHGEPDFSVRNLVRHELSIDLAALVARVKKHGESVSSRLIELSDSNERVRVSVHPVTGELDQDLLYLISFDRQSAAEPVPRRDTDAADGTGALHAESAEQHIEDLEDELATTREHLQTVIEELETTNEELQSSNEELQSANEELQSSNEQLETTNEELQSTNEELTTVNDELSSKTDELNAAYTDLANVKDSLTDPVVVVDENLRIKFYNPACERIFASGEPLEDCPMLDVDLRVQVPRFRQRLMRVVQKGEQIEVQLSQSMHTTEEGGERGGSAVQRFYLLRMQPYLDQDRAVRGAVITFFDNTSIKRAERDARESESRLHAIVNRSPVITTVKDRQGRYVIANHAFESLLGLQPGGAIGRTDEQLFRQGIAHQNAERERAAWHSDTSSEHEETVTLAGESRTFIVERFPLLDEDGHAYGLCTKALDITARRRAEAEIRLQSKALDASINGVLLADARQPDMPSVYVNPAFQRITGYRPEEAMGANCRFLQGPDTDAEAVASIRHALRNGTSGRALLLNYRADGTPFWNDLSVAPVHDDQGEVTHFVGIQQDVTQRVRAEQAGQQNEERLRTAQDYAAVASFEWHPGNASLGTPEQLNTVFGITPPDRELTIMQLLRRVHGQDRHALLRAARACLRAQEEMDLEFRVNGDNGQQHWLQIRADAERDFRGRPIRLLGLVMDISRRKDVEHALLSARVEAEQANRAKSEFLSHMSHELRTPLNAILGFGQLLESDPDAPLNETQSENVQHILRAGWHLLDLISEVLDLARIESGRLNVEYQPTDLRTVVEDSIRTVAPMADQRRITLEHDVQFHGEFMSDTTRLTQILLNLLTNAVKYNHDDGHVRLVAWDQEQRLHIAVSDTGIGISHDNRDGLFESFNRLGQEGGRIQGTGIGLVLVQRLLALLGGEIQVASTPGEGSTFTISLPFVSADHVSDLVAETDSAAGTATTAVETVNRTLRILYVEDNPSNMALAREIFRRDPSIELLEATEAESGIARATSEQPDLILMDLHLPGMHGQQALDALRRDARTARIPVVAVSADVATSGEDIRAGGFAQVLTKPLRLPDLRRALTQCVRGDEPFEA